MDEHIKRIVEMVCMGRSPEITPLHYEILGLVAYKEGADEGHSILHELRDIIDKYRSSNRRVIKDES